MEERLIEFETAKLAKGKGFNIHCDNIFEIYKDNVTEINSKDRIATDFFDGFVNDFHDCKSYRGEDAKLNYFYKNNNTDDMELLRPTQSLLQKWLREVHQIFVSPSESWSFDNTLEFVCTVNGTFVNHNISSQPVNRFKTYEEALEAGMFEALKLIK